MSLIYIKTQSGERTNIMSWFQLWDREMLIKDIKNGDKGGQYRYGSIGGYVSLLKEMSLETFDSEFLPNDFTPEEITKYFRKEISEKYGEHKIKSTWKALTKTQLEVGNVYLDFGGCPYLYLGEVKYTYIESNYGKKKTPEVKEGLGFKSIYGEYHFGDSDCRNVEVLKGVKKLLKKSTEHPIHLVKEYNNYADRKNNYICRGREEWWNLILKNIE